MILAISGSLRRSSINSAVLRAAAKAAARDGLIVRIDDSLRRLPHFDPDLEPTPPDPVVRFRQECERAAALLLAVPEYAFGIPGASTSGSSKPTCRGSAPSLSRRSALAEADAA